MKQDETTQVTLENKLYEWDLVLNVLLNSETMSVVLEPDEREAIIGVLGVASLVEEQAERIERLHEALALAQSMIRGGEKMSDTSEKIFRDAFDSSPSL